MSEIDNYAEKAIQTVLASEVATREGYTRLAAILLIKKWVDLDGFYQVAKNYSALVDNSGETFAIQFMTIWNDEVSPHRGMY